MKETVKNILITLNNGYVPYAAVMLTSLFDNNNDNFSVFCVYNELEQNNQDILKSVIHRYGHRIEFLHVDKEIYAKFPTTDALTVECYFILLAYKFLPREMERILYLDSDMIIDGNIDELYNTEFRDKYMVVCGQAHKKINGNYFKMGARPEHGECFNSGVILFNLPKFREEIGENTYLSAADKASYDFHLADQGILNIVFWDKVIYLDTMKYNFRISIYEDYVKDTEMFKECSPIIYHYVMRDYFHVGVVSKPWMLTLSERECRRLEALGVFETYYPKACQQMNHHMHKIWWLYAKKTVIYREARKKMMANKKELLERLIPRSLFERMQRKSGEKKTHKQMCALTKNKNTIQILSDCDITYKKLEKYIDSLDKEKAIQTMNNIFAGNCERLKKQTQKIRVAFMVYSVGEWQCENLYRKLEKDERFLPTVVICGYGHGFEYTIRDTYIKTCQYFTTSKRDYNIVFSGYKDVFFKDSLREFNIIVYVNPFGNIMPIKDNMQYRNIGQLCVHIPYGIYAESKNDTYYADSFWNKIIYKLSWKYYCESIRHREYILEQQVLEGYNIVPSGLVKMDSFYTKSEEKQEDLWKQNDNTRIRMIWAPHFNLREGMNGTFHMNYMWLYNYAKQHSEISWIVRPHPRMEWGAITYNVFENSEQYNEYLSLWNELSNARVMSEGDYIDAFTTSDAMILDCLSFLSEYQYTGKPLLMLLPNSPRPMSDIGNDLMGVLYKARGADFNAIEDFINNVKAGRDELKERREQFFDSCLNYYKLNGKLATDFVYDDIVKEIFGDKEDVL